MPRQKKQVLKQRADGRYVCRFKGLSFYGRTSEEALDARSAYKRELQAGRYQPKKMTVSKYAASWLPVNKPNVARNTYNQYACQLNRLCDVIGEKNLSEVKPSDAKRIYTNVYKDKSASLISKARIVYIEMFDSAVEDGYCNTNPFRSPSAKPHKGSSGSHREITAEERRLIHEIDHPLKPAIMVMLYAGLRVGQVIPLKYEDCKNGYIHVNKAAHLDGTKVYITNSGKTASAIRNIPVFEPLKQIIENGTGYIMNINRKTETRSSATSQLESFNKALSKLAGHEIKIRYHDLRHSFCCWCCLANVDIKTLMYWMGHANESMILQIYDHVSDTRIESEKLKLTALCSQNGSQKEEVVT